MTVFDLCLVDADGHIPGVIPICCRLGSVHLTEPMSPRTEPMVYIRLLSVTASVGMSRIVGILCQNINETLVVVFANVPINFYVVYM